MKRCLLFICLVFSSCFSFAQKIDSLLTLLKTDKEDTNKVNHLNNLSNEYRLLGEFDKGLPYGKQALALAQSLSFKRGIANSYNKMGGIYIYQGNYPEALKNFLASLKLFEELNDKKCIGLSCMNIGMVYGQQGNYPESLKNIFTALKMAEEIKDKKTISSCNEYIGNVYINQKNYSQGLKHLFSSLKTREETKDNYGISNTYINIGEAYRFQGNYSEALKNYNAALKIKEEIGDKNGVSNCYNDIAIVYDNLGKYPEALKNYNTALKIKEEIGDKLGMAVCLMNLGEVNTLLLKIPEAETYLTKSLPLSIEVGDKEQLKNVYAGLAVLDSAKGNFKAAFEHNKWHILYRDSLVSEESKIKSLQTAMQYEFDKKETELKAKAELEKTITEDQHIRKQLIYTSIIILITVMAFFLLNRQRLKSKKDKIIFEKQEALLQAEKQKTEDELLHAKNLLINYTENLIEKNKAIEELQFEMEKLKGLKAAELYKEKIDTLDDLNNATILTNEDWEKFKELFEQVYKGFFIRLKDKFPNLTNAEIRLISLIKLNLDTKQMANMLGVSPNTIKVTKYRLRKKIDFDEQQDLDELVQSI